MNPVSRQSMAGFLAGAVYFLLSEPGYQRFEAEPGEDLGSFLIHASQLGLVFGGLLTTVLVLAAELGSPIRRMVGRVGVAVIAGSVLGAAGSLIGNVVYASARAGGDESFSVVARTLGWVLFGAGVGAGTGLAFRSPQRAILGLIGGLVGGAAGGVCFDLIADMTSSGMTSRAVGFLSVATLIGATTALLERAARRAWLTYLTGAREGREVPLFGTRATLGRDELVTVPLFGDPEIPRLAAELVLSRQPYVQCLSPDTRLVVDGQPVAEAPLGDGSVLQLGRHRLRFHCRGLPAPTFSVSNLGAATPGALPIQPVKLPFSPQHSGPPVPGPVFQLESSEPSLELPGALQVRILTTPGFTPSQVAGIPPIRLMASAPPIRLGRDVSCEMAVPDPKISRLHALIEHLEGAWLLVDQTSRNGTRLNGVPVNRAGLTAGDRIYLGDSILAVEEATSP